MIISTFVCLCIIFSQVNAQSNTLGHCKEDVCCNKQRTPLLTSCKDIKRKWSDSPSGYYQLGTNRGPVSLYCNMDKLCGFKGGWTRFGYLNMADPSESCPSGFKLYQHGGVRACGRSSSVGSCVALKLLADDISYSQVCSRVVGYQYRSTDAVFTSGSSGSHNDINSHYVDGVSITRGFSRQHVWTLMAGLHEASYYNVVNDGRDITVLVLNVLFKTQLFSLSLVMTTSVNLVILLLMVHINPYSMHLIHCGMVKDVVVLKVFVVQLLVFHGFIRNLTLPLLTTLS